LATRYICADLPRLRYTIPRFLQCAGRIFKVNVRAHCPSRAFCTCASQSRLPGFLCRVGHRAHSSLSLIALTPPSVCTAARLGVLSLYHTHAYHARPYAPSSFLLNPFVSRARPPTRWLTLFQQRRRAGFLFASLTHPKHTSSCNRFVGSRNFLACGGSDIPPASSPPSAAFLRHDYFHRPLFVTNTPPSSPSAPLQHACPEPIAVGLKSAGDGLLLIAPGLSATPLSFSPRPHQVFLHFAVAVSTSASCLHV
jgi:hypothetical protein